MLDYFYASTWLTQPITAFGEQVSLMLIPPSRTVTGECSHSTPVYECHHRESGCISMATATFVLVFCSPFHIIHLKAILQTGVNPGNSRDVQMARTSQQQILGP